MSKKLLASLVVLAAVLAPGPGLAAQEEDPGGPDLVETCRDTVGAVPEAGERTCRSLEQLFRSSAGICRFLAVTPDECSRFDGHEISESRMEAFEASWVARALDLQRGLDDDVPLRLGLMPHTHNSFNSAAYTPTVSGLDHNQVYSVEDQLRMGIRAIELDVHWAPHGDPEDGGFAPILCHGQPVPGGDPSVHAGCTAERHLETGLIEIRGWLDANPDEVVVVYLENNLDGREDAHAAAAEAIERALGDFVLQPPRDEPCDELPIDLSRAEVRAAEKQVVLTGNCGPGAWGSWVHVRGERWDERGAGTAASYPPAPACADRATRDYDDRLVRIFEDSTWLTAMADGTREPLTPGRTRDMVRCGVNLPGFDQLRPFDGRLSALVWSWAPDEPSGGDCAYQDADGRFRSDDCNPDTQRHFACFDGASWAVTEGPGPWDVGAERCGPRGDFAVPRTGFSNDALAEAKGKVGEVWVDYRRSVDGEWTPAPS